MLDSTFTLDTATGLYYMAEPVVDGTEFIVYLNPCTTDTDFNSEAPPSHMCPLSDVVFPPDEQLIYESLQVFKTDPLDATSQWTKEKQRF